MQNEQHSRIAPSSANRWVNCTGSVSLNAAKPDRENEHSKEGDAVHWVAKELLYNRQVPVGTTAPNGIIITDKHLDTVMVYINDVKKVTVDPVVETTHYANSVHADCYGTIDSYAYKSDIKTLFIWDLKNGYGIIEPFENWQLLIYAIAILDAIAKMLTSVPVEVIDLRIVQPRPYHPQGKVRSWKIERHEIDPYIERLRNAAGESLSDLCTLSSGGHCRYCDSIFDCPASRQAALNAIDVSRLPVVPDNINIGRELDLLKLAQRAISNRVEGIEGQIEQRLKLGTPVEGYTLSSGKGNAYWSKPVPEVYEMGRLMGKDLRVPCTPAQAIKGGVPSEVVAAYSNRKSSLKVKQIDHNKAKEILKNG